MQHQDRSPWPISSPMGEREHAVSIWLFCSLLIYCLKGSLLLCLIQNTEWIRKARLPGCCWEQQKYMRALNNQHADLNGMLVAHSSRPPAHGPQQQACLPTDPSSFPAYGSHQPAHSESLASLTGEGLYLLKPACRDSKRWLLLQKYEHQCKAIRITKNQENTTMPKEHNKTNNWSFKRWRPKNCLEKNSK